MVLTAENLIAQLKAMGEDPEKLLEKLASKSEATKKKNARDAVANANSKLLTACKDALWEAMKIAPPDFSNAKRGIKLIAKIGKKDGKIVIGSISTMPITKKGKSADAEDASGPIFGKRAIVIDGTPYTSAKRACEILGVDYGKFSPRTYIELWCETNGRSFRPYHNENGTRFTDAELAATKPK